MLQTKGMMLQIKGMNREWSASVFACPIGSTAPLYAEEQRKKERVCPWGVGFVLRGCACGRSSTATRTADLQTYRLEGTYCTRFVGLYT